MPDSAATATAFECGVKSKYFTVGVDDSVIFENCSSVESAKVNSILKWASDAGQRFTLPTNF